ncbi:hypothetical protein K492DRAFT_167295 [Lichtheimia hyalospora FSU 10163]|nr:hypothetical protein K492DRAFT_167295 [Lichtheimia hyalospora FSU 10163]
MAPTLTARKQNAIDNLSTSVPQIFNDAQKPNATQRKHAVALRKIQEQCALNSPARKGLSHDIDPEGEAKFNAEVIRNINKILNIRKREPHADRIVRFIATFMQYTQQLDTTEESDEDDEQDQDDNDNEENEYLSARFVEHLLRHLLRGTQAKHKPVRLRCCQIIALSINSLGEIDEELYQQLRSALFGRIRDKESSVRIQAATALSRLQSADDEVDPKDGRNITGKLLWLLQHDPSAEVRRVVLFNLDKTEDTIPYILERARDIDGINRRVVFLKPMAEIEDFRTLTLQQRNDLLKWGLNDRDRLVRRAASRMLANHWIRHADNNLLEFLERLDVVDSPIADDVLTAFLNARTDIVNSIKFEEQFWENLSTESAFMAKVFIQFLKSQKLEEKLDEILPEVTRHAFSIQSCWDIRKTADEDMQTDYDFIIMQLLNIAKCLDYADEVGRRKMFALLREMLMDQHLHDEYVPIIVELFKIISPDERDFTRVMIEIIADIQELSTPDPALTEEASTPSKRARLGSDNGEHIRIKSEDGQPADAESGLLKGMLLHLKCLTICRHMLELSEESLQDNSTLYGILNELIVPSVQSKEVVLREEGLHCLGLACALDKHLGHHNIPLFVHCLKNGHEQLQQKALMIIFDMIMIYGLPAFQEKLESEEALEQLFEYCLDHDSVEVQGIAVEGLSKLMLTRSFKSEAILKLLVVLYFFPTTVDDNKIQQCLSYFFPAYCYSSHENQLVMVKIAIKALMELCDTYADLEKDERMVTPAQISDMLADWTDPRRIALSKIKLADENQVDNNAHADVAIDALESILKHAGLVRKTMVHLLGKLHLADVSDERRLEAIGQLVEHINKEKPLKETAPVRNAWTRFCKSVDTIISKLNNNNSSSVPAESAPGENIEESCMQSTTSTDSGPAENVETPLPSSSSVDEPTNK